MRAKHLAHNYGKKAVIYMLSFIVVLIVLTVLVQIYNNTNTSPSQPDKLTYVNETLGISLAYPANMKVIKDEERSSLVSDTYPEHSILIAGSENLVRNRRSIQINIEDSTTYSIPWSGGQITTITEDSLQLYHSPGPNKTVTGVLEGRPIMKSYDSSSLYGSHTRMSIIDKNRLIKINIDSVDADEKNLHNEILSSFTFLN